jgi:hypothetical protein
MSYKTINACANDQSFQHRLTACCAQEGAPSPPSVTMFEVLWSVAAMSDIEAAYASALAANHADPGGDESVITDQMILSAVQANWPP